MSDNAMIRIESIKKHYGEAFTLHVDTLDVRRGEVFCLLGPTGSGKSTLLKIVAGLEPASQGRVFVDGAAVDSRRVPTWLRRRITMVHQRPQLLTATVRTNVEYGLRLRGIRNRAARLQPLMKRLDLWKLAAQSAQTLSGGQTQLVALARSLVLRPEILILDEPTANLDPARVALVEDVVREAREVGDVTTIWATHNLFQARRVADRIGLLWNGQLIEVASHDTFFESPRDKRTADFVSGRLVY